MYNLNMQRLFLILGIFFLILPSLSAVEVTSVTKIPKDIHIQVGSRLLIPCRFNTDTTTHNGKIEMEWVRIPFAGGSVKSLVYVYNPELVEYFDSRAHVFLNNLRHGDCSLVIDPVLHEDDGFFELNLKIDGNSYEPFPSLSVQISEDNGQENDANNLDEDRGLFDIKQTTIKNFFKHSDIKSRKIFKSMMIFALVFLALSILGSAGVSIYLVKIRKKKRQDELRLAEEGLADCIFN